MTSTKTFTTPLAAETHDFTIKSGTQIFGYMGEFETLHQERVNAVVASARIGTDKELSEGLLFAWSQDDWAQGIDLFHAEEDTPRLYTADGRVQSWVPNILTIAAEWASSDAASGVITCPDIVDFSNGSSFDYICMGKADKLRIYDDALSAWADEGNFGGGDVLGLHEHNDLLYVAVDADDFWRWDGTKTSGWGQPGASNEDANGFTSWDEKVWLWHDANIQSSTDGVTWAAAIQVGDPGKDIVKCYPLGDVLMVQKPEGFYYYDGTNVKPVWTESFPEYSTNGAIGLEYEGFGFANVQNEIRRFFLAADGENFTLVTPDMKGSEDKERWGHGLPIVAFAGARHLYVGFKNGEGTSTNYAELLAYNGAGWHQVYKSSGGNDLKAAGLSGITNWMLVNHNGVTYRKRVSTIGEHDLADYPTDTDCQVLTFWFDAGLMVTRKDGMELRAFTRNCSSTRTIKFEYQINDSGTWIEIATVADNPLKGTRKLIGGITGVVSFIKLQLRITFRTDSATERPALVKFSVRYIPMQHSQDGYQLILRVGDSVNPLNDYVESQTVDGQINYLNQIQNAGGILTLRDAFGEVYYVKNTNRTVRNLGVRADGTREKHYTLTLLDMYPGVLKGQGSSAVAMTIGGSATLQAAGAGDDGTWGGGRWGLGHWGGTPS